MCDILNNQTDPVQHINFFLSISDFKWVNIIKCLFFFNSCPYRRPVTSEPLLSNLLLVLFPFFFNFHKNQTLQYWLNYFIIVCNFSWRWSVNMAAFSSNASTTLCVWHYLCQWFSTLQVFPSFPRFCRVGIITFCHIAAHSSTLPFNHFFFYKSTLLAGKDEQQRRREGLRLQPVPHIG